MDGTGTKINIKDYRNSPSIQQRNLFNSLISMLLLSITLSQLMFLLIITIVIPFGRYKFKNNLNEIHYSVIGSMNQAARLTFSIFIGKSMQRVGKKNYMLIGYGLLFISQVGLGIIYIVNNATLFFILCIIMNFIMGAG